MSAKKQQARIYLESNSLVVRLPGPSRVLSCSRLNGGYREDIEAVFNHHVPPEAHGRDPHTLPGGSWQGYLAHTAQQLGLNPERSIGLLTAAHMENAATETLNFREIEVTAIATAGVDVNGGRAGDPARYYEAGGEWTYVGGTINIILLLDTDLTPPALVRAVVTATEAKTAALQELMAPSCYSRGLATGSGTDQIAVVAHSDSPICCNDAGHHSKLGELIGVTVKTAVKRALEKQTGLNPQRQRNFLARLKRYGVSEEDFWRRIEASQPGFDRGSYLQRLNLLATEENLVTLAATLLHMLDEFQWGLLSRKTVCEFGHRLLDAHLPHAPTPLQADDLASQLLYRFVEGVNQLMKEGAKKI
ncbi:adenosylcobinamide amidohydrolase [Desulfothermobacter acidiphilus]|uniref:adenosylcobinamide amidohydrolase n=1 Tax=Desulfothermobacter acidiphilus TaxID=1938353 RepID=UPI003F8AE2F1